MRLEKERIFTMKRLISLLTLFALLFLFTACNTKPDDKNEDGTPGDTKISISENGHLVINGIETTYEIKTPDEITVSDDGYLVVNGKKTDYKVDAADVITVDDDGYLVVNGVKTDYIVAQSSNDNNENEPSSNAGSGDPIEGPLVDIMPQ